MKNSRESTAKVYDHEGPELLKHNHDRKYLSYHHEDNEKGWQRLLHNHKSKWEKHSSGFITTQEIQWQIKRWIRIKQDGLGEPGVNEN